MKKYKCETCHDTGWYGDNGPGIKGNREYHRCDICGISKPIVLEGTWPKDDLRRAFVAGVAWWEYHKTCFTMWQSDRQVAEEEAEKRYPDGKVHKLLEKE